MTAPHRRRPLHVVCAALAGLVLIGALAGPVFASEAPEPAGPTVLTPDKPDEDEGNIRVPGREAESEHLFLAVIEAAADRVDAQDIVKAVESADMAEGTRFLLAVDQQPSDMESTGQLVRGMLLFGQSDALADDWVENGKTKGYVGQDWIVVGVILPESAGGPVDVSIDTGRNIELTDDASLEAIARSGKAAFDAGNYTAGLSKLAVAAGTGINARSNPLPWVVAGAGVVILAGIGAAVASGRRRKMEAAGQAREKEIVSLQARIMDVASRLQRRAQDPQPRGARGQVAASIARLTTNLSERTAAEERAALNLAAEDTKRLKEILERLTAQQKALHGVDLLLGGGRPARQAWQQQIQVHGDRLQDVADGLGVPGARNLETTDAAVSDLIEHTRALEDIATASRRAAKHGRLKSGYDLLDRLEVLRRELDTVVDRLLVHAAGAEVDLGPALTVTDTSTSATSGGHDALARLAHAVDLLERADQDRQPISRETT